LCLERLVAGSERGGWTASPAACPKCFVPSPSLNQGRWSGDHAGRQAWGGPPTCPIRWRSYPGGPARPHLAGQLRLAEKARELGPLATAPMRRTLEKLCSDAAKKEVLGRTGQSPSSMVFFCWRPNGADKSRSSYFLKLAPCRESVVT
jgi:hypothetical protein